MPPANTSIMSPTTWSVGSGLTPRNPTTRDRGYGNRTSASRHRCRLGAARQHHLGHGGRRPARGGRSARGPRYGPIPRGGETRRQMDDPPVAEEGAAALLPPSRFGADGYRHRGLRQGP